MTAPKLVAEPLDDDAGVHPLGGADGGDGGAGGVGGKQGEAEFGDRRARRLGEQLRVLDQLVHADTLDIAKTPLQSESTSAVEGV